MKIATLNINSIRARSGIFFNWLQKESPDIIFLQEIKCETNDFLYFECESLGYKAVALGQKSYNGVAILSKYNFEVTSRNLPNFQDDNASRYLELLIHADHGDFYVASVYAPNGASPNREIQKEKFAYKIKWFDKFYDRAKELVHSGLPVVIGGDFNIMMTDIDVFDSSRFKGSPLYRKEIKDKIKALEYIGLHDSFRLLYPNIEGYTFWDYTANSFVTNSGLRIDYLFITAEFAEKLQKCTIDKDLRREVKPSDHTVLMAHFED